MILDNSKVLMLEKVYDVLGKMYKENFEFLATDTDSIICAINNLKVTEVYEKIKENIHEFDGESFKSSFGIPLVNKKVNSLLGDDAKGKLVKTFIWLRPKSYILEMLDNADMKKINKIATKGVPRKLSLQFTLDDFAHILKYQNTLNVDVVRFCRENLNIFTIRQNKKGLTTSFQSDSKRHFLSTSKSLAYGHIKLEEDILAPWSDADENFEILSSAIDSFRKKFIVIKNF